MLIKFLFLLVSKLPLPVLHLAGVLIGRLYWRFAKSKRHLALCNLRLCFPEWSEAERERIGRRSCEHYIKTLLETPLIWVGSARRVCGLVKCVDGGERVDAALAHGKGLIIAAMHLGNFEAGITPMAARYPMTGLFKPVKYPALCELSRRGRTRFGGTVIPIIKRNGKRAVGSQLLRALKRGEIIYALPDRDPPRGQGVFAPFFGVEAHSPVLVPKLVQATGARLLFCVGERLPRAGGFRVRFVEPPAGWDSPDLDVATAAVNAGVEACVRQCPEQYWWAYKRFKRRPYGQTCVYRGTVQLAPAEVNPPQAQAA